MQTSNENTKRSLDRADVLNWSSTHNDPTDLGRPLYSS